MRIIITLIIILLGNSPTIFDYSQSYAKKIGYSQVNIIKNLNRVNFVNQFTTSFIDDKINPKTTKHYYSIKSHNLLNKTIDQTFDNKKRNKSKKTIINCTINPLNLILIISKLKPDTYLLLSNLNNSITT